MRTGPKTERLTISRAATHETELGDHDFCLSRSHYIARAVMASSRDTVEFSHKNIQCTFLQNCLKYLKKRVSCLQKLSQEKICLHSGLFIALMRSWGSIFSRGLEAL